MYFQVAAIPAISKSQQSQVYFKKKKKEKKLGVISETKFFDKFF